MGTEWEAGDRGHRPGLDRGERLDLRGTIPSNLVRIVPLDACAPHPHPIPSARIPRDLVWKWGPRGTWSPSRGAGWTEPTSR